MSTVGLIAMPVSCIYDVWRTIIRNDPISVAVVISGGNSASYCPQMGAPISFSSVARCVLDTTTIIIAEVYTI